MPDRKPLFASAVAVAVTLALAAGPARAQDKPLALVGGHVIPISGPEIDEGTVLVERGKITAVGPTARVMIPPDATRIDVRGKFVMPGLVDTHSHIGGVGGADGSGPVQPDVRVMDSLNVRDSGFRRAVAGGLTTLNVMPGSGHLMSGQTIYLKLRRGTAIDDLAYRDAAGAVLGGLKLANGTNPQGDPPFPGTRGKSAALVRAQFIKAQEYRTKVQAAGNDPTKLPARDLGLEALVEVLDGKRIVHHHTHRADDIETILRLKREFGFRVVLHHVSEAWKIPEVIAKAGVPCSVIVVDSPGGKLEATELTMETGGVLERAGVLVAFHTDDWITDSRLFLRSAALAVRNGMSRAGALRALTLAGAKMLDLDGRVGSLEPGKDGDVIILSADPLSVYAHVLQTFVEGQLVFDRNDPKDRLAATGGFGAARDQQPYLCCAQQEHGGQQ